VLYYFVELMLHLLSPRFGRLGVCSRIWWGWKGEYGTDLQVFAFSVIAEAINNVNNIKVVKWFKSLEHRLG
jgi:hypothetical protein